MSHVVRFTTTPPQGDRVHHVTEADVRVVLSRLPPETYARLRGVHFNDRSRGGRVLGYVNRGRREIALCALPPRIALTRALTRGQTTEQFGARRGVQWPPIAIRRFLLYDVFLHELGHLQVVHADETSERRKFAMETRAQEFAMEWCQRLWSKPFDHPDPVHNIPTKAEFDDHDPELTELERRVRADPENADLHQSLGRLYLRRGRADDAIAAYRESLTLDPSNVWTWLYLGNWYYERGDDESALESFSRAAELMPGNETALWCMANVYERQGLWDLAETHYRKAVALNPTSKTAHRQLKSARRRLAESSS